MVRVPLGGRTVRGFVTARAAVTPGRPLRPIAAFSGDRSVFDKDVLETVRWAAIHYVAPLAVMLGRCAPPNLPRAVASSPLPPVPSVAAPPGYSATSAFPAALIAGRRPRPQYLVAGRDIDRLVASLAAPLLAAGRSVMVVGPTVQEVVDLAATLAERFGDRVVIATSALTAAEQTGAWSRAAAEEGLLLIGTREIAFWPVAGFGMAIIVDEGRRAMKAPQTPTVHVREVLRRRSTVERFGLAMIGPVPSSEALAAGVEVYGPPGRVWPLVEIADRRDEPPGGGIVMDRTRAAIAGIVRRRGRVFVLVHRRGYAPAFRCVRCREVRRCATCGSLIDRSGACRRCGAAQATCQACGGRRFEPLGAGIGRVVDDLGRSLHGDVGTTESDRPVVVGTERDLVGLEPVDLAVSLDADALVLAPNYRAREDALRLLARLALSVRAGRGRRCLVQTAMPDEPVIETLRSGRPLPFQRAVVREREDRGFPPVGEMIAVETSGAGDGIDMAALAPNATVLGPAATDTGQRWLIQGSELRDVRIRLRTVVQDLRDRGVTVRIDADPLDL